MHLDGIDTIKYDFFKNNSHEILTLGDSFHLTYRTYRTLSLIRLVEDESEIKPQIDKFKFDDLNPSNTSICSGDLGKDFFHFPQNTHSTFNFLLWKSINK